MQIIVVQEISSKNDRDQRVFHHPLKDYRDRFCCSEDEMQHISAAELAEALKGARFPARKDDLIAVAIKNNPVIQALERLPGREFNSVTEVEMAFSEAKRMAR